jgi:hypothetical protein
MKEAAIVEGRFADSKQHTMDQNHTALKQLLTGCFTVLKLRS